MTAAACEVHGEFAAYGERNANDEPPFTRHETDRVARTVAAAPYRNYTHVPTYNMQVRTLIPAPHQNKKRRNESECIIY